jgi:hypothetical protein
MWDSGTHQISPAQPPLLFDTEEEAQTYSNKKWKTGRALEYPEHLKQYWREYEQERAKKIAQNVPPEL